MCWKLIEKSRKVADMFVRLGEEWIIDADLMRQLEEYVCSLFSKGKKHLNMLRYEILKNMYEKQGKIQNLSLLPPCQDTFQLRSHRCNYVAKVWKSCLEANIQFSDISEHGWSQLGEIIWTDEALPESISGILISSDDDVEEEGREDLEEESSSDYDSDDF